MEGGKSEYNNFLKEWGHEYNTDAKQLGSLYILLWNSLHLLHS